MTTIKTKEETRDLLKKYKGLTGHRSFDECIEELVTGKLKTYCYTKDGYVKEGSELVIEGSKYTIIDTTVDMVFARSKDTVLEFHKNGKIAWEASIV